MEQFHNPNFKPIEFDRFKAESGDNAFTLTPQQWMGRLCDYLQDRKRGSYVAKQADFRMQQ